jgi:ABC-type branched-subunit amino acid transport system ATPase component
LASADTLKNILAESKTNNSAIIRVEKLSLSFGGVRALTDISIDVKENEILAIIGPNGAGKTCLLNCISGFYRPQQGEIFYRDERITRKRPTPLPSSDWPAHSRTSSFIQAFLRWITSWQPGMF